MLFSVLKKVKLNFNDVEIKVILVCNHENINIVMSERETVSLMRGTKKSIFRNKINPGISSI